MSYRITVDVGGTFSDVTLTDGAGGLWIAKAPTTRDRASSAILSALEVLGEQLGRTGDELLADTELFVYSTTRATNAILEKRTARTALLTTAGFPDLLVRREGGRTNAFDHRSPFPEPYVPRRLTFEVPERIDAEGGVVRPLDEAAVDGILERLDRTKVEAAAVCLLWSVVNPAHELRVGELLAARLPHVAVTLSHQLWPALREYRRASATAIDASLKPLMGEHLRAVADDLAAHGFAGELLAATSFGGVMHLDDLSRRPIYSVKSGPALAPVAGRAYAGLLGEVGDVVVCDTGGTSFDVSLVRDGEVVLTSETWLGGRFVGDLIPTSSVDARSIGSGGGSIARMEGGLLRVGPESAGADPGPACYGRGGDRPTVTDAAAVLGYLDPERFNGGRLQLDLDAASRVLAPLASALGRSVEEAAAAVLLVANEHMVSAIQDITVHEGLDPRECLLVAGGGACGLTIAEIARSVGARRVLVPGPVAALSAVGGQRSDVVAEFNTAVGSCSTAALDRDGLARALADLRDQGGRFAGQLASRGLTGARFEYVADARYAFQVWTIELPVDLEALAATGDAGLVSAAFDRLHHRLFAVAEPGQVVELLAWRLRVTAPVGSQVALGRVEGRATAAALAPTRLYFPATGWVEAPRRATGTLAAGERLDGPALLVDDTTTLVVHPGTSVSALPDGSHLLEVQR